MIPWHTFSVPELFERLTSTPYGISQHEAEKRQEIYGLNERTHKSSPTWISQFLAQLQSPLIYILSAAALAKTFLREFNDVAAILFVIIFNALLGFFQERKAEHSLQALKKLSAHKIHVLRGCFQEIDSRFLVPGDIFMIESGTKIPADARLIETHNLSVDESSLTGESVPVVKNAETLFPEKTLASDQQNMVFTGTVATSGRGKALVVATGMKSEFARITKLITEAEPPSSPLKEKLEVFGRKISVVTLSCMLFIIIVGWIRGFSLTNLIVTCVSLTVSAIPEGLPIAVTVALSYGLLAMAKQKALIRKLPTIETLGCTTVICTDKTGTITKNEMVVDKVFIGKQISTLTEKTEPLLLAAKAAFYCSEARLDKEGAYLGDPVDIALKTFANSIGEFDKTLESELILPFESELRMMACSISENGKTRTFWKGSFETIASRCSTMWLDEKTIAFSQEKVEQEVSLMAKEGYKVLALATKEGKANPLIEENLTLIGIVGLYDPPRREAEEAIAACQKAGIKVIMLTGDHPETALTIARQINLHSKKAITGQELDTLSDEALLSAFKDVSVCARVTPHHKWRIVQLLQSKGEVVAMTGDGVNDAPALQQADIGIALGTCTDVAREASSMVIVDNNFATIVAAIKQGRTIFRSLQQMASYLLTTCLGGVLTIAGSIGLGIPLPLLPLQLLWINLVTDGTTTVPLALEGGHGTVLAHPPRPRSSPFISATMVTRALLTSFLMMIGTISLFLWDLHESSLLHARTIAFSSLAFFQIFNALNARSLRRSLFFSYTRKVPLHRIPFLQNRWLLVTLLGCAVLQIIAVEWHILQPILNTTALSFTEWAMVLGVSSTVIFVVEIHKWIESF